MLDIDKAEENDSARLGTPHAASPSDDGRKSKPAMTDVPRAAG